MTLFTVAGVVVDYEKVFAVIRRQGRRHGDGIEKLGRSRQYSNERVGR